MKEPKSQEGKLRQTSHDSVLKKQRHHFADKGLHTQSYGFPVSCTDVRTGS